MCSVSSHCLSFYRSLKVSLGAPSKLNIELELFISSIWAPTCRCEAATTQFQTPAPYKKGFLNALWVPKRIPTCSTPRPMWEYLLMLQNINSYILSTSLKTNYELSLVCRRGRHWGHVTFSLSNSSTSKFPGHSNLYTLLHGCSLTVIWACDLGITKN